MGCNSSKQASSKTDALNVTPSKPVVFSEIKSESNVDVLLASVCFSEPAPEPGPIQPTHNQTSSLSAGQNEQSQASMGSGRSKAVLKKARTALIDKSEVDFMVRKFICHDNGTLANLGQGAKESTWLVQAGREAKPIEIKLHVDRTILTSPEVGVECDGSRIFPLNGYHTKTKLKEDFVQQWPFRGVAKGIGQKDLVEVNPPAVGHDWWFPATLTKQREDGDFEAFLLMTDEQGRTKEVFYPAVRASNIRYRWTGRQFFVPERTLKLEVPAKDPLHATLTVDSNELMTHFFAHPTPNLAQGPQPFVLMKVTKDRQTVTSDVGHQVLTHHLSNEVRLVKQSGEKHKRVWTIQVGPFAEHTIEVENRWKSKVVTLSIDGEKVVEASAEDIDCPRDQWECKFRFVGERRIDYEIYETNVDRDALDNKAIVSNRMQYSRECVVSISDESNLASADLVVDGVHFRDLPPKRDVHHEDPLEISPVALHATYGNYGVQVPYKINEQAPSGLSAYFVASDDKTTLKQKDGYCGFFQSCMQPPSAQIDEDSMN